MVRIEFLPDVSEDLQRVVNHLEQHEAEHVQARVGALVRAFDVLVDNPLIGRPVEQEERELVMGRGAHGYVALYQYVAAIDTVFVLAIRAQREGSYTRHD